MEAVIIGLVIAVAIIVSISILFVGNLCPKCYSRMSRNYFASWSCDKCGHKE